VHAAFVGAGAVATLLGPMLPVLSARWSLSDTQAGYLFTAQFLSSMAGVALSGTLIRRGGYRRVMGAGVGAMAIGAAALAHAATHAVWLAGLLSICIYGLGIGLTSPTANLLVARLNPARRAAALNLLNFSWGLGAVGCPFAVAFLVLSHHIHVFLFSAAAALALLAAGFLAMPAEDPGTPDPEESRAAGGLWRNPLVFALGALFFLYVGAENCISGWVATYTQRMHASAGASWALTPSLFWGALLLGRAAAPAILRTISERRMAGMGALIAACGVACLLAGRNAGMVWLGAGIAGLGLSSVFPVYIAVMSARFGAMASKAAGILFAFAGLGGAVLPNLVGLLSTQLHSLRLGMGIPLLSCLGMFLLFARLDRTPDERIGAEGQAVRPPPAIA
jgi:fucose permease